MMSVLLPAAALLFEPSLRFLQIPLLADSVKETCGAAPEFPILVGTTRAADTVSAGMAWSR